jgi:hypothetical protein
VIAMQHYLTNDTIYENMFILFIENGCQMIDLSRISIVGILEHDTHTDAWML